jgi:hypothetical protein
MNKEAEDGMPIKQTNGDRYTFIINNVSGKICCDIHGDDLIYGDYHSHHGVQCNFNGDTEQYNKIIELCKFASDTIKAIHILNNKNNETGI